MDRTSIEHRGSEPRQHDLDRELSRIEHQALLEAHRLRSVEFVATAGMVAISHISALERTLTSSVPSAAARLRAMGDMATKAMASEISEMLK